MATISFTTKFNLTTNLLTATDTSDWAGQGIATADVNGCLRVIAPSGTIIYNNTDFADANCDIWINNDLLSQQTISLPLVGLLVESGTYSILYSVYDTNTSETYTVTNTYDYEYVAPEVCIENTVDCISPLFTSIDATDYDVAGITPSITRSHKLYYPPGNVDGATFLSSAAATITTGDFYQGSQTTVISTVATWTFSDGLIVTDLLAGSLAEDVDCTFICSIYCCIKAAENRMMDAKGVNNTQYLAYSNTFQQIMAFAGLATLAIQCGKPDDVNGYLAQIQSLSNCTADCSCSGTTPSRVTGLGGIVDSAVVVSGGAPIVVTPVTVGSVTTYTVSFSGSTYNTIVAAGTNVYAVTDSGIVAGERTFTVKGIGYTFYASGGLNVATTGPVLGEKTVRYTLVADAESSVISQSLTSATDVSVTDATLTIPASGDGSYIFSAELCAEMKADSKITITLYKNAGAVGNPRIYGDTAAISGGTARMSLSFNFTEKLTGLVATDVITMKIKRNAGADPIPLTAQSLSYLKVS
jgi:hypothetical protein